MNKCHACAGTGMNKIESPEHFLLKQLKYIWTKHLSMVTAWQRALQSRWPHSDTSPAALEVFGMFFEEEARFHKFVEIFEHKYAKEIAE